MLLHNNLEEETKSQCFPNYDHANKDWHNFYMASLS